MKDIKYLRLFFLVAGILLVYKLLFDFSSVMVWKDQILRVISPFLVGLFIAYCLNIPCRWLEGKMLAARFQWIRKIAKPASIIFVYLIIALLMIFAVGALVPMVYDNITDFVQSLPSYFDKAVAFLQSIPSDGLLEFDLWIDSFIEAKPWNSLLSSINTSSLLDSFHFVTNFFSGLFNVFLAVVSSIYFLSEFHHVKGFFKRLTGLISSEKRRNFLLKYVRLADTGFRKFLTCQVLDSLVIGSLSTIEFAILGSPYALLLGLMLAVVNIVPYFGSIIGTIIAILIMALTNGLETALLTAVILLITQQLDGNFIQPKIMGASFSISPILIIIGISIGGSLGGVPGMIFAIPVVNVIKTALEEYIQKREAAKLSETEES